MEVAGVMSIETSALREACLPTRRLPHIRQRTLNVTHVIRRVAGGAQGRLVLCDDGKLYVLKMQPNPQGPNVLANEALGTNLIRGLGLLAPPWRRIKIDLKAVRLFSELTMQTRAQESTYPACGIHFGSEYLGGPQYSTYDVMPRSCADRLRSNAQFLPIYLFDVWASHQDDRQCVYQRARGNHLYNTFFIDNGHLFGGPAWSQVGGHVRGVCSGHIQVPERGDPMIEQWLKMFEDRIPKLLERAIEIVPTDWYEGDIHALKAKLLWRLESVREFVDRAIVEAAERRIPARGAAECRDQAWRHLP